MQLDIFNQPDYINKQSVPKVEKEISELDKLKKALENIENIRGEIESKHNLRGYYESSIKGAVNMINSEYGAGFASYHRSSFPDERGRYIYNISILNKEEILKLIAKLEGKEFN